MQQPYKVNFSNRLELLCAKLREDLFSRSSPFAQRLVVVASPLMKTWLLQQLAADKQLGIAMGMQVIYLQQALNILAKQLSQSSKTLFTAIPSSLSLTLAIEKQIREKLRLYATMSSDEQQVWQPITEYLSFSKKGQRRLVALSDQLAALFQQYGLYAGKMMKSWEETEVPGWQQELWRCLFCGEDSWSYPSRDLEAFTKEALSTSNHIQVHIFGLSLLTRQQLDFLAHASQAITLHYYFLSPCQDFWSDMRSDRDMKYFLRKQANVEEYFQDRHPLLANMGRLGRQMARQVEESEADVQDCYETPQGHSLLGSVQTDMLLLRNADVKQPVELERNDHSIQVHIASSRMREVEILYDNLLDIIDRHSQESSPITPRDILVMAPDIVAYEVSIRAVFGREDSKIDFQLFDLKLQTQSSLVQGYLHLLGLAQGRWDTAALLQLFENPQLQQKHKMTIEEVQQLRKWIQKSEIYWGEDSEHRGELLQRNHCERGIDANLVTGTWEQGIDKLLLGLTLYLGEEDIQQVVFEDTLPSLPLESVSNTQAELLGKWVQLFRSLREDLHPLSKGVSMTLRDWSTYLTCICEAYFAPNEEKSSQSDYEALLSVLSSFSTTDKKLRDEKYPWITIESHLQSALSQGTMTYRESHVQAVCFCSLLPMRALPAKVVSLLGMEESIFPKRKVRNALDLMTSSKLVDYCPTPTDYDRYLFLEALLSARDYLLISYAEENEASLPSLLVSELLSYLDNSYLIDHQKPSQICVRRHPFHSFDKSYFASLGEFHSYSQSNYRAAHAFYDQQKQSAHCFLPEFFTTASHAEKTVKVSSELVLDIRQLIAAARNPLKIYFQKNLGIFLNSHEELKSDEPFTLSPLQKFNLRKSSLAMAPQNLLKLAEKQGVMPSGVFNVLAKRRLVEDAEQLQQQLAKWNISSKKIYTIDFREDCQAPTQNSEVLWTLPAIDIPPWKIVGKISDVTSEGLLVHGQDVLTDLYKVWPYCLLLNFLPNVPSEILFTKNGKRRSVAVENAQEYLKKFIEYSINCQEIISPLLPEWIPDILTGDLNKGFSQPLYNEYVCWVMPEEQITGMNIEWLKQWRERANDFWQRRTTLVQKKLTTKNTKDTKKTHNKKT